MTKSFREIHPPPYEVVEIPAPGYKVVDANGFALVYLYVEGDPDKVKTDYYRSMGEALAFAKVIAALGRTNGDS